MVGRGSSLVLKYSPDASCMACHSGSSETRLDTSAWVCTSIATRFFRSIFCIAPISIPTSLFFSNPDSSAPAALRKGFYCVTCFCEQPTAAHKNMSRNKKDLFAHLLAFLLFEDAAQDFPRWVARDGIDIFYLAHVLVGGELAIGPGDQFIGVHFFITCTQDNKGFGNLSCLFVRFGDDGHVGYSGMFQQQGFELGGGNAETFVFNQLLFAIGD